MADHIKDMYRLPEDERIRIIGETAAEGKSVGVLLDPEGDHSLSNGVRAVTHRWTHRFARDGQVREDAVSDIFARFMAERMRADIDAAIRGAYADGVGMFNSMGGTFSNVADDREGAPLTAARLLENMRSIQREFPPVPQYKIIESEHVTQDGGRVRPYPKRKAKSLAHWRRMDKKWRKRYGFKRVPCMYKLDESFATGRPGIVLIVHPALAKQLYAAIAAK